MRGRYTNKRNHARGRRSAAALLLSLCCAFLSVFVLPPKTAPRALAADPPGITFEEFARFHTFSPSTLFVGTYVIEFKGLNGQNFQDALVSREMYQQYNKYYKTELAGRTGSYESWRDILNASSIAVIMPLGKDIPKNTLKGLYITVYIDEDGVPHDPSEEAKRINPFLYPDPYDFEQLPEFEGLWEKIEADPVVTYAKRSQGTSRIISLLFPGRGTNWIANVNSATEIFETFFPKDELTYGGSTAGVHDSLTDLMDKGVNGLWDPYLNYADGKNAAGNGDDADGKEKARQLYSVMSRADATRRAEVFYYLALAENHFAAGRTSGPILPAMHRIITDELKTDFISPADYAAAVHNSTVIGEMHTNGWEAAAEIENTLTASQNAYSVHAANRLVRGHTGIAQYRFDLSLELMEQAEDAAKIDAITDSLVDLKNIEEDNPDHAAREYTLLETILIPLQDQNFSGFLTEGIPDGYPVAGDSQASRAMLTAQQTSAQNAKLELESYVVKLISRSANEDALLTFLNRELAWIHGLKASIPRDDYASYAERERSDYEAWLLEKIRSIESEIDPNVLEPDTISVIDRIVELEEERDRAIRYDDPKKAKEIEAEIDALKDRVPPDSNPNPGATVDIDPVDSHPYDAMYDGDGFPSGDDPSGGNPDMSGSDNPEYTPRDYSGEDEGRDRDSSDRNGEPSGTGDSSGSGSWAPETTDRSGTGDEAPAELEGHALSTGDLDAAIRRCLGGDITNVSDDAAAAMICALNQFGREYHDDKALERARDLLGVIMSRGNVLVYTKYQMNLSTEYVSMGCVDKARKYTRYRCVRDGLDITMTRLADGEAYVYQAGSTRVDKSGGGYEYLSAAVALQEDSYLRSGSQKAAYLAEEDAQRKLGCRAEYIVDSPYAVCVTSSMEKTIAQFVRILKEVAGYIGS